MKIYQIDEDISIGIAAIEISMIFQSAQFSFEENYMRKYCIHPLLCKGIEGVFGFIFNLILCIIFNFISCGEKPKGLLEKLCNKNNDNVWRLKI